MKAIDLGNFDIHQLSKLQREQSARNRHLFKTTKRFQISFDGKIEFITTHTKMLIVFPIPLFFLDAWVTYKAIRTQYHPEYASIFDDWIE